MTTMAKCRNCNEFVPATADHCVNVGDVQAESGGNHEPSDPGYERCSP